MPSELLSSIAGGGSSIPKLAPSTIPNFGYYEQVSGIDATGGLTEILSLTGKFILRGLYFSFLTDGDMNKIKLTIDGEDIFNEDPYTPPSGTTVGIIGATLPAEQKEFYLVENSLSLSVQMATDNDIRLNYFIRPIQ